MKHILRTLKVDTELTPRLDIYLHQRYSEVSRTHIAKIISKGQVYVNATPAKASTKLRLNDKIKIDESLLSRPTSAAPVILPIIFQDDYCVVVDKPSGMLSHAKGAYSDEPSVASFIKDLIDEDLLGPNKDNNRAGIVHRLDRGTSGIMICAKSIDAQKYLSKQFSTRKVKKTYYAIISGKLSKEEAQINMPIERNPRIPATFKIGSNGKSALTKYKLITTLGNYSLVKLSPVTGRTHQLRVHLKALNHPIVGDFVYGGEQADRMMLHASEIELTLPIQGRVSFIAPIPDVFSKYFDMTKLTLN